MYLRLKKGTQWTHNSTYQVPDIAWLKMGGGDGRRAQRNEGDAFKKREKKERLDKENKQVRSMLREKRSKKQ